MDYYKDSLFLHEKLRGKIGTKIKMTVRTKDDLSLVYSPGVAEPCRKIAENKADVYKYTMKGNTVAIITDGTAVLGLGSSFTSPGIFDKDNRPAITCVVADVLSLFLVVVVVLVLVLVVVFVLMVVIVFYV
jgi:malate dehydrogenase (oxaloacetate-decarboxylating)